MLLAPPAWLLALTLAAPSTSQQFLVVDATTGAPVAGARVEWIEFPGEMSQSALGMRRVDDLAVQDERFRTPRGSARSDAQGAVAIDLEGSGWLVRAVAPGRFGCKRVLPSTDSTHTLELRYDFDLELSLVDPAGRPVEGAVACLRRDAGGFFVNEIMARSDPRGRATLPHAGYRIQTFPSRTAWFVGLAGIFEKPVHARITTDTAPRLPIELVVPASTTLELELRDDAGQIVAAHSTLVVRRARDGASPPDPASLGLAELEGIAWPTDTLLAQPDGTGRVRIAGVGPGIAVDVGARRNATSDVEWLHLPASRPEGRQVLVFGSTLRSLHARVVDEEGKSVSGKRLRVLFLRAERSTDGALPNGPSWIRTTLGKLGMGNSKLESREVLTNRDGGFTLDFDPRVLIGASGQVVLMPARRADPVSGTRWSDLNMTEPRDEYTATEAQHPDLSLSGGFALDLRIRRPLPRVACARFDATVRGQIELGTVALGPPPSVARGQVVHRGTKQALAERVIVCVEGTDLSTTSDDDGRFELLGLVPETTVDLSYRRHSSDDARLGARDVPVGSSEVLVEVDVPRRQVLAVRLLLPDGIEPTAFGVHVQQLLDGVWRPNSNSISGLYQFDSPAGGVVAPDFIDSMRTRNPVQRFSETGGVVVGDLLDVPTRFFVYSDRLGRTVGQAAEIASPSLVGLDHTIDMRNVLPARTLTIVDPAGKPVSACVRSASLAPSVEDWSLWGWFELPIDPGQRPSDRSAWRMLPQGVLRALEGEEVYVTSQGNGLVSLRVAGDATVRLPPGREVELRLQDLSGEYPLAGRVRMILLRVGRTYLGTESFTPETRSTAFDASGKARLRLPTGVPVQLAFQQDRMGQNVWSSYSVEFPTPWYEVPEGPDVHVIEIAAPRAFRR